MQKPEKNLLYPLPVIFKNCKFEELLVCFINVLYPKVTTKLLLVDILSRIPLKGMEDFPWTVARIENIFKNLKEKNIVNTQFKTKIEDGHGLVCYLLQFEEGRLLAEHLPSRLRTSKQNISAYDIDTTQARVACYLNSEKAEVALRKIVSKLHVLPFYNQNPPDNFYKKLRPNIQIYLIRNMINAYFYEPLADKVYENLSDYIKVSTKNIISTPFLDYEFFVSLDKEKIQEEIKILKNVYASTFESEMYFLVSEFCYAKTSEDCIGLAKKFKELHKNFKKFYEDNKYTFPFPVDYIYLFTLLRAYTNLSHKEDVKKDYFAYLKNSALSSKEIQLFEHLIHQNLTERMLLYIIESDLEEKNLSPLKAVLYFIALYQLPREELRDAWLIKVLKTYFSQTKDNAPFVASFYAQFLAKLLPEIEAKNYQAYKEKYQNFDLSSLFSTEISWEKRMEAIYDFMLEKEAGPKKKISKNPKRLAWFVSTAFREIYPYEQSFSKESWTRGRKVSALKLRDETDSYTYLTEQDIKVIKSSVKKDYWSDVYYVNFETALPLLIDHPFVFDDRSDENLSFTLNEPVLEIEQIKKTSSEENDEYKLLFSLPSMQTGLHVKELSIENCYELTSITASHIKLKELMGEESLTLPKKAQEKLFNILSQEKSPIKVRTKIEFNTLEANKINAKPCLRLKRLHLKNEIGLEIQAIVYPLLNHSTSFIPTKGAESFVAKVKDSPMRILRKFEEEYEEIEKLLSKSQMLKENLFNENYSWTFEETEQAYQLLTDLQEADISLEWFNSEPIKISKNLQKEDLALKVKAREKNKWFSLDATINIDEDLVINMRSLLKNVSKHKGRFIPLANGQIIALAEDFRRALDKVQAITQEDKDDILLHSLAVPAFQSIFDEDYIEVDAKWLEWKEKLSTLEKTTVLPHSLNADLREYQKEGFYWLASLVKIHAGACLADDMGLGKTLQTITLLLHLQQENNAEKNKQEEEKPFLIIAPTSVCHNWELELAKFAPQLNVHRITADYTKKERINIIRNLKNNDILIIGYALLNAELETLLNYNFKLVIFDEAQALKNPQAIRSKASYKLNADSKLALTGTPVENSLDDLWSIFNIINPGLLGSLDSFNQRFNPSSLASDAIKNSARANLKSIVRPFILRRTKTQVLEELPPRIDQTLLIEPSPEESALYEALRRQALENIEKAKKEGDKSLHFHMLAELTKLRQACCNPLLIDPLSEIPSSKLELLIKLVKDLQANNHKALIFSQFTSHLKIVYNEIEKLNISALYLDGSTPEKKRAQYVSEFQARKADIFCISLKAGGQGLNLTAADYVIHLDPWWNPAVEDQASDRAHRMGQLRPVTIYRLIMQNSIEEKILKLHATKRELASDILLNTDTAHKLSLDDLLLLLQ